MNFEEFRLLIQPDVQNPGQWSIHVQKCGMIQLLGPQGAVIPKVTAADLSKLRNATAPPNLQALEQLGQAVLDTIMPAQVKLGFSVRVDEAKKSQCGVRLIVVMLGDARSAGPAIGLHELPLEAAFSTDLNFIALNIRTPISRGVKAEADLDAVRVAPPLRVLVVASEPSDMPPVKAALEKAGIRAALAPLINSRAVVVDFCEPPTLMQLDARLQKERYHVVHFIGHGDFAKAGLDPNPQPHLYFEDGTSDRWSRAADVVQLFTTLRNGNVPLVVLTACSTAAAAADGQGQDGEDQNGREQGYYRGVAFESLAKALVESQGGPLAAIAMQFDLETEAARIFSPALYGKLLIPGCSVDEAVSSARSALVGGLGSGHRSWVNPTVYWRCKEGRVFDLLDITGDLSAAQREEIAAIDAQLEVFYALLNDLSHEPQEIRNALAGRLNGWQAKVNELLTRRGLVLGDTVRLRGGLLKPDGTIECALTLRLRLPATVGDVSASVQHDPAEFDLIHNFPGQHAPAGSMFVQENPGAPTVVLVRNASQGNNWAPGEYELAKLEFRLKNPTSKPLYEIKLVDAKVNRNGVLQAFQTLNAVIFPMPQSA